MSDLCALIGHGPADMGADPVPKSECLVCEIKRLEAELEQMKAEAAKYSPYSDGAMAAENERLREALDDAFLAGWDHYHASRSRMDMPRDRIKCLEYWKEKEALK